MRKRLLGASTATVLAAGGLMAATPWHAQADPPGEKTVTATLFERPYASVGQECTDTLGPAGYGYVEVSPATEHIQGDQWWTSYQPVSYKIAGRLGDRTDFQNMVKACDAAGVKVIADAVVNHMSSGSGTGTGGTRYTKYGYPGTYEDGDFHACRRDIKDYTSRDDVQNCELVGLADLDTGSDKVRSAIAGYLDDLRSLGVAGFRIDAAKHMAAADVEAIKGKMAQGPGFWVSEVIHGEGEAVQPDEYTGLGDVDEFRYGRHVKSAFQGGGLGSLQNIGDGKLAGGSARTFVDNWDTERNGSTLSYKDGAAYTLANVFMLAHPYGSPNVYSGYEFSGNDAGPPSGGSGWTGNHAKPEITGMVGFRNAVGDAGLKDWWSEGAALSFSRDDRGFVAVNNGDGELSRTFQTSLPAGSYCNVASAQGGCDQKVEVTDGGTVQLTLPARSAVALYVDATG
ncbi:MULTISPECIES: alpha-amylase family protein [unclassified Streptomyces]|uniref:alpha-amylase n=1 Tax=unclassified Streptomyces TaxID=2593676 RepID=UPI002DDBE5EB|nr:MULTISPECIES: alpha-amylase family protein [unclassified Streptomyces]WSA90441.1 alpha-amylase family protein [Streptomyces sp. NBC_01795]WSS16950.1 alpha-amylase family protein [Streptomyces sp. NBC_01186]WSS45693.1 alpha-amylase family protein [Streptomyces sp. NBC_01187]